MSENTQKEEVERGHVVHGVVGLPGSGKSYFGKSLAEKLSAVLIDDPKNWKQVQTYFEQNPNRDFVICDCFFCEPAARQHAEKLISEFLGSVTIKWYFFEKNVEQCRENVDYRNDGRNVGASIRRFSKTYVIPEDYETIPVWHP